jgi:glucose/arabinose dehydrogenase/mono/diheme cytochrome c family protein
MTSSVSRHGLRALSLVGSLAALGAPLLAHADAAGGAAKAGCPQDSAGLKLAPGFCATVFADKLGHPRHMVVSPSGVVYVNTWSGLYYGNDTPPAGGFLVALQDTSGKGKADVVKRFGETVETGGHGGTGIALYKGALYAEINDKIVRYTLASGSVVPSGAPTTIVSGLPLNGDHPMHPFAIDADGMMYVDVASATNACQEANRMPGSHGVKPCVELETRAGIWRYDANKTDQKFSPTERYATGIRNADGITIDPSGHGLYATQHGRDQLAENWPELYKPEQGATLPAEQLMRVEKDGDYGWPECYFDPGQHKLVLAPEYGGDGGKTVGDCARKTAPLAAYPAHWAPDDLLVYSGKEFPDYGQGAFIAFHGSWNRAPFPQGGYNVVFQPLKDGKADGTCVIFADGFAGADKSPGKAEHRPTGLALGPDGALYISDDAHGRIYRVVYQGGPAGENRKPPLPCPSAAAAAGKPLAVSAAPPEGLKETSGKATGGKAATSAATAGVVASLPVPPGASKETVAQGSQIYHAQVGTATCTGCHGADGTGTPLGPNLAAGKWQWSDGSVDGIRKTITEGVAKPKNYRAPMPPMGGAQLTPDQVSAVSAYVWALSHGGH